MITTWLHHNDRLELHDERGLLYSWPADATQHGHLAFPLNLFPAFGSRVAQLLRPMPTEPQTDPEL